jgi:hypothetical protein
MRESRIGACRPPLARKRQKVKTYFLSGQLAKKDRRSLPFFGGKATQNRGQRKTRAGVVFRCFYAVSRLGFAKS